MDIEADDRAAHDRPQSIGHLLVLRERKRYAVPFRLEIWRAEAEQRVRPIASINARHRPFEPLNVGIRKANLRSRQRFLNARQNQPPQRSRRRSERLPFQLAAEAMFPKAADARRAPDIDEDAWDRMPEPFAYLPARWCPIERRGNLSGAEKRKAPINGAFSGGASRSRTGLHGFAGRCITALLSRRKRSAEHRENQLACNDRQFFD